MPKPLLMMSPNVFAVVPKKTKKKATKKKPVKKKVKPVPKPVPIRPSVVGLGDKVWWRSGDTYMLGEIVKVSKWDPEIRRYTYNTLTSGNAPGDEVEENQIIPAQCFPLMANDIVKLKACLDLQGVLNTMFDAKATILAGYRKGQKRPWAYFVIPDLDLLYGTVSWKTGVGEWSSERSAVILKAGAKFQRFLSISSAPQEILSYLGVHVYGRRWVRHGLHQESEPSD